MTYTLEGPKWGSPDRGVTATISWSFADLNLTSSLDRSFSGYPTITGSISAQFRDLVRGAFNTWSTATGLTFVENADAASNNIRVGAGYIDGAGPTIGEASYWFSGSTFLKAAIDFDTDAFSSPQEFASVALHEIGHAIGLGHSTSPLDTMYPYLSSQNIGGLTADDIAGARALYSVGLTLQGSANSDLLSGAGSDDVIYGYEGADTIAAGEGNNTVVGGRDSSDGADYITAGSGADLIFGNGGSDTISSGAGSDIIVGGFGADSVLAGAGNDLIYGNQDNDVIFAGFGDDTLIGGKGDDTLYGNEGNDVLFGNEGADRLVFGIGSGNDIIKDFSSGEGDRLDLQGQTYSTTQDVNGNVVFTLSGGGTITLAGISVSQVGAGFFA